MSQNSAAWQVLALKGLTRQLDAVDWTHDQSLDDCPHPERTRAYAEASQGPVSMASQIPNGV